MSVLDRESIVEVALTQKDLTDIASLRMFQSGEQASSGQAEDQTHFLRQLILAGIDKLREDQAKVSYAQIARDPDYIEYHQQRRTGRARRR